MMTGNTRQQEEPVSSNPIPSKAERVAEFIKRLGEAPLAATSDEAFQLVCDTLNAVEDELTNIPYNQETSDVDGRLYPPLREGLRTVADHPNVLRHRHRWHNTYFGTNGSVEIQEVRSGNVLISKPGQDGRGVWQL
jgi:hypothetical protein